MDRRSVAVTLGSATPTRATANGRPVSDIIYSGDRPTVRIVGQVDRELAGQISGWIRGLIAAGVHDLVVDVSGARACTGRILTVLARASAELAGAGDSFTIIGLQLPEFIDVLPRAGLDEIFVVYDVVRREAARPARVPAPRPHWVAWPPTQSGSGRHRR